jgi:hypothetical protein
LFVTDCQILLSSGLPLNLLMLGALRQDILTMV